MSDHRRMDSIPVKDLAVLAMAGGSGAIREGGECVMELSIEEISTIEEIVVRTEKAADGLRPAVVE